MRLFALAPAALFLAACGSSQEVVAPRPIASSASADQRAASLAEMQARAAETRGPTPVVTPFQANTIFTTVELDVDLRDPNGQRRLVPYLIKPEEWLLVACRMTSATSRHYTFKRMQPRGTPDVDPLRPETLRRP